MVEAEVLGTGGGTTLIENALETVKTEVYSIIANLISVIKVVLMYVYQWMMRFWSWFSENPIAGVTFMANVYVFMS